MLKLNKLSFEKTFEKNIFYILFITTSLLFAIWVDEVIVFISIVLANCALSWWAHALINENSQSKYIRSPLLTYCYFIGAIILYQNKTEPQHELLIQIISFLDNAVAMAVPFFLMYAFMNHLLNNRLNIYSIMQAVIKIFFMLNAFYWLMGNVGDALIKDISAHPQKSLAFLVVAMVIGYTLKKGSDICIPKNLENELFTSGSAGASLGVIQKLNPIDVEKTATHETGHALLYCVVEDLPDTFHVKINETTASGALGYVSGLKQVELVERANISYWYMMVLLAGGYAERFRYGDNTMGATSDNERWMKIAKDYLINDLNVVFYPSPSTYYESQSNNQKLEDLRQEQLGILNKFFIHNEAVFYEFIDELIKKKCLKKKEIQPLLNKAVFTEELNSLRFKVQK